MDEWVIKSFELVFLSCETAEAILMNKYSKWLHVSDKDINS